MTAYVAYHFFSAKFFLDPFVEVGGGYTASDYADSAQSPTSGAFPISATMFWYGAAGMGVNLGPIGVFAKLGFNGSLDSQLDGPLDDYGNPTFIPLYKDPLDMSSATETPLPPYRFTIGAKLIL